MENLFNIDLVEALGILAAVTIAVSAAQKNVLKLRIINIVGCVLFITYGYFIGSLSVVLLNTVSMILHIYYLVRYKKAGEHIEK